jgi:pre-mRNA-splicing helicase BRR2
LGTVSNVKEAVDWLGYTYLYVRMMKNPSLYGAHIDKSDPQMVGFRVQLVHAAATLLSHSNMVKYDLRSQKLLPTALGKIASHYYIKYESMQVYTDNLKPHMTMIDIFRLFSLSKEFEHVPIRENEKQELQTFYEKVPIPVKGSLDEPSSKINILL